MGEPDRRRNGEDDGADEAGREPEAEEHQRRDEIDEGRQRLHQVEHRAQQLEEPFAMRRRDADRHADPHRHGGGADDERQRLDGLLPEALVEDVERARAATPTVIAIERCRSQASAVKIATMTSGGGHRSAAIIASSTAEMPVERPSKNQSSQVVRKSKNCLPHCPTGIL